jgi:hypothetical protein
VPLSAWILLAIIALAAFEAAVIYRRRHRALEASA